MRTETRIHKRFLAVILTLLVIIAMIPANVISVSAATEDQVDAFTIFVKDSDEQAIEKATVKYSFKVDGVESLGGEIETDEKGIAAIKAEDMKSLQESISNPDVAVTLDAEVSKIGYDDKTVNDETVTDVKGNVDIELVKKETVKISITVKDSVSEKAVSDAAISITGYNAYSGKTSGKGVFEAELYVNEKYYLEVSKKGYKAFSAEDLVFEEAGVYNVPFEAKLIDDTFAFDEEEPDDIEYGDDTYVNQASCSNSTGSITYSVESGDSVSVDSDGYITTLKAGTSTIKAVLAEDDDYQEAEITYDITVTNAPDYGFVFDNPTPANRKYVKDDTFTNKASGGYGTGAVTYEITSGSAATIDAYTGKLTIKKAGTVTVTATRAADDQYDSISTSYSLTIEKADQSDLVFDVLSPEDQFITIETYINEATGGDGEGAITYSIKEGSEFAEIEDEDSPEVTLKKVGGPVVVKATKAGDDRYEPTSAEYTFHIIKSPQTEFRFRTTTKTITYSPTSKFNNSLTGESGTGKVTYEIETETDAAEINENTGLVTLKKATDENGIVIKATKAGDDKYEEATAKYTLIINKAKQTGFAFADGNTVNKTWSPDSSNTYTNPLSGGESTGDITYSVVSVSDMPFGGPCATLDTESGEIKMNGKGAITVKAVKEGDDCYKSIEAQFTLNIARAEQSSFDFDLSVPSKVVYNENENKFTLSTVGGSGAGAVSYSIEEGDAVSINTDKAKVVKSGTVTVKATKAETNTYEAATVIKVIVVEKADQFIAFEDTVTTSIVYGNEFTNAAKEVENTSVPDGKGYSSSKITYSVIEGDKIVSVDNNGKLSFNNNATGKITIQADKAGDDCYNDTSEKYSLNVVYADTPENPYRLEGEKLNDSGWYSNDVTIIPLEGYQISYSNSLSSDNTWKDKLVVSDEGYNGKTIYLKNEVGITGAIHIPADDIRIDKTTPDNLSISYSAPVLGSIFEAVSFGFYQSPAEVTIEADDEISQIASFEYSYGDTNGVIEAENIEYSEDGIKAKATFTIPAQYRGAVSFKATDTAGYSKDKHDSKAIVVDDIAPGVTVSFDNNESENSVYYSADRTATIRIEEANFFSQAMEKVENDATAPSTIADEHLVITVKKVLNDGTESSTVYNNANLTTPFTETSDGVWEATLLFDEDADYTLTIDYKDFSGNAADTYETSFTIDKINPVISVSYDNNEAINTNYYKANRTATFTVVEHNFRPAEIVVETLTSKDVQGEDVNIQKDYQNLLRTGEWISDGDTHTLSVPFDVNANYQFVVKYKDLAGNEQDESANDDFTVDKTAPSNLNVSYSTSVLDTILETITFGFYNSDATVTISADDITSGVDYFTYSYGVQVGASSINVGKEDTIISTEDIVYSENGKVAAATFAIPAQFRGSVSFTATDKAGNVSEAFNDEKVIVVDEIAPGVSVSYDNNTNYNETYYNADRTATITINEANFFNEAFEKVENISTDPSTEIDEHLVIKVTKVDNENNTITKTIKSDDLTTPFTPTEEEDTWAATLLFDEDADYTWNIEYKDFSGNVAGSFTDSFTIDKISPVISIDYDNHDALNEDHYKNNRIATVTIEEHNFRAKDIVVKSISAVDIQENDVDYEKDYEKLLQEGEWKDNGNVHTLEIPFDVDARYSFEIAYSDLADNAETESIVDEFCVDKLAPYADSLKVSYSTSILDTILQTVTFGFYNAPATVTIEADDITSGVDYFTYTYQVSEGESSINEGKSDIVIATDEIEYSEEGKHAKATFAIPPQFRGKVSFTATDRAGNTSEIYEDGKVIVVDNVAPGVSVSYDNNSARYDTYYNKARTATIKIEEANFFEESLEKLENIAVEPSTVIDEHLVIIVKKEYNDGSMSTVQVKSADLASPFRKSDTEPDTWQATLLFDEDADYSWSIEYMDFSGSSAGKFEDAFTVDNIDPVIDVTYQNNSARNEKYFKADRPVTIAITEHNFNAEDVVLNLKTTQATGKVADYAKYLKNSDNWSTSGDVHTANIVFNTEAYYTFDVSYVDMAGRGNEPVNYGSSVAPTDFVIDKTAPTDADITINNESVLAVNGVAFEKFYQSSAVVKYSVNCDISGLDNITYQKVDALEMYSANATWTPFDGSVKINPSEKFIIFFKAVDKAGNVTIVNSTGIVVDDKAPEGEKYAPDIDILPEAANENGLHNSNVKVDLTVVEPKYVGSSKDSNGYYSGINKVTYRIYTKDTDASEQGTLLDVASGQTSGAVVDKDKLISKWTGQITVTASVFNSNQVIVEITAVDNAGNERITTNEMINKPIKIDVTAPSIDVSYQDGSDNGDDTFSDTTNGAYFKNDRTATIVITERNFDESKVKITATKDGQPYTPDLSGWSTSIGGGNGDGTTHTATITYSSDGIYSFEISFTDQAGNENSTVNYSGLSPQLFTVDKTNPVFSISYDNNSAQNGNYYKEQRTATLTIEELNFEESRIKISLTATDNGSSASVPSVNGWSTSGSTHTATITYSSDALYEFDIEYTDKAGNALREDYAKDSFYIDQTAPKVSITKIVDKSANNDAGNIGYIITATDTNFDVFTPKLIAIVREGNRFVVKELDAGSMTTVSNGRMYVVTNLPNDGVYKISCTVVDKAGNAYEDVTLSKDREDKETYTEKRAGNDTLLTFSVNREGSTFNLDDNTINLLSRYYVQQVDDNVVIDEINVDTLEKRQVSINGRDLSESEYGFEQSGGDDENWYRYQYSIDRTLFSDEGEYNVVVSSKDRATNDAFSDVKDAGIDFVVDRTAPIVTVTGLSNDGRYQTESQTVTAVPTDDGGELQSIVVTLIGQNGNPDKELLNLSDDNFIKALEEGDGKVTFEVPEGLYQDVRIICDDKAYFGSNENIRYDETFTNVSVTPSAFLIFWANKPLRYGIVGGIGILAAGITVLIVVKNRKKKKLS